MPVVITPGSGGPVVVTPGTQQPVRVGVAPGTQVDVLPLGGGPPGPAGPQGPPGPPGETPETGYVHVQGTPIAEWVITHNLGFYPNVTVVDSAEDEVEGAVTYQGTNTLIVVFSAAFSGKAYLS